jgi:hypothetical protein
MKNEKKDFFLGTKYILLTCMKIIIATNLIKNIVFGPSIHLIWEHFNLPVFLNLAQKERAIREFSNSKRKFVFDFFSESNKIKKKEDIHSSIFLKKLEEKQFKKKIYQSLLTKTRKLINTYYQQTLRTIVDISGDFLFLFFCIKVISKNQYKFQLFSQNLKFKFFELPDDKKAFFLILLSDTCVGFHSSYGWEILLETILKHFGLPQERSFIFLFVATLPVLFDTLFKYWVFKHLNALSPSIVTTYHKMNE